MLASRTLYLYGGWNVIGEFDQVQTLTKRSLWGIDLSGTLQGAGGVGGLAAVELVGEGTYLPAYDGNGNISSYVDSGNGSEVATFEYGPFGELLRSTGAKADLLSYRFSTKPSEGDLYYYGYRYYDPSTGRWLNRDPLGEAGGLNLYGFVGNDGVTYVDVLGLYKYQAPTSAVTRNISGNTVRGALGRVALPFAVATTAYTVWEAGGAFLEMLDAIDAERESEQRADYQERQLQEARERLLGPGDIEFPNRDLPSIPAVPTEDLVDPSVYPGFPNVPPIPPGKDEGGGKCEFYYSWCQWANETYPNGENPGWTACAPCYECYRECKLNGERWPFEKCRFPRKGPEWPDGGSWGPVWP